MTYVTCYRMSGSQVTITLKMNYVLSLIDILCNFMMVRWNNAKIIESG